MERSLRAGLLLSTVAFSIVAGAAPLAAGTRIGFVGLRHGHCWRQLQNVGNAAEAEFAGVAESEPELVEEAKKIRPEAYYTDDYRELVERREPEIVWAFVENNRHREILEYMAPRGVHVIFEKPLASSHEDAVAMQQLARRHKVKVMTNYQMAWWPTNHEMRRQAAAGKVGDVWRLHGIVGHGGPGGRGRGKFFFSWLTDPIQNGAGALVDFGCYNAVWAAWFKGLPDTVYAAVNRLQRERFPKVEDNSVMVLTYPDGVGLFEGSWDLPRGFQELEAFGRTGSLAMNRDEVEYRDGRKPPERIEAAPLTPETDDPIRYMIDRVVNDKPLGHIVALDINVQAVEILEAAKQSIREGRAVRLPLR